MECDKQFDKYVSGEKPMNDLSGKIINEIKIIRPLYKNSSHMWYYECECVCDKHWKAIPSLIKNGHTKSCGCKKSKANRISEKEYKNNSLIKHNLKLIEKNIPYICLEYNGREKSLYQCVYCGKKYKVISSNMLCHTAFCDCPISQQTKHQQRIKNNFKKYNKEIKNFLEERNYQFLYGFNNTSGNQRNILCLKCDKGHNFNIDLFKLLNKERPSLCPKCQGFGLTREELFQQAYEMLSNKKNVELLEIERKNKRIWYKLKCTKHNIEYWQSRSNCEYYNGCPQCNSSKGEDKIREYLKSKNVDFIEQYKFKDCKNINPLPFDFYIPSLNLAIEYDGEQHYKPVDFFGGEEGFLYRQQNDKIKTQYCNNNNIKLIRIPYTEFDNIENLLNKELKV